MHKSWINYILAALIPILASGCIKEQKSPLKILQKVENTYQELSTYEFQAVMKTNVQAPDNSRNVETPVYYAADLPGKQHLKMQTGNYTVYVISNGNKTWTYIPQINQYTEAQQSVISTAGSSPSGNRGSAGIESMASQLKSQYENITSRLVESNILGEETLTINGEPHETYVLQNRYESSVDLPNSTILPTKYWVDKKRHIILKQEMNLKMESQQVGGTVQMTQITRMDKAKLNQVADSSLFTFIPPEGAEQVKQLEPLQRSESQGTPLASGPKPQIGNKALPFELTSLSGVKYSLADLKGKVVMLDFWATWCGPCRELHPVLDDLYKKHKDNGLVVLGINAEESQKIKKYVKSNGYSFINLIDSGHQVTSKYRVGAIPSIFVINRKGEISSHLVGMHTRSDFEEALEKANL